MYFEVYNIDKSECFTAIVQRMEENNCKYTIS